MGSKRPVHGKPHTPQPAAHPLRTPGKASKPGPSSPGSSGSSSSGK